MEQRPKKLLDRVRAAIACRFLGKWNGDRLPKSFAMSGNLIFLLPFQD